MESHPLRMRGLKPTKEKQSLLRLLSSHPLRMRGLKPPIRLPDSIDAIRRILYGCVD